MKTRSVAIGALAVAMSATLVTGGVPGPTTSFGLPHDPLGEAQLLPQPDGRLVVSNIGSSGKDGVSIDLGEGTGWEGVMDFGPAGALNPGTELFITCQPAGASIHLFETGGGSAGLGFLPGGMSPECVRVELYNNGQLVDTSEFDPASLPPALVVSNIGSSGQDGVRIKEIEKASPQLARTFDHEPFVFYDIILSVAQDTNFNGQPPVQADQIRIVLPGQPPVGFTQSINVTGANLPQNELRIDAEGLNLDGLIFHAIDQALLETEQGRLKVSNLGSSGCDGVSIAFPDPPPLPLWMSQQLAQPLLLDQPNAQLIIEHDLIFPSDPTTTQQANITMQHLGGNRARMLKIFTYPLQGAEAFVDGGGPPIPLQPGAPDFGDIQAEEPGAPIVVDALSYCVINEQVQFEWLFATPMLYIPPGQPPVLTQSLRICTSGLEFIDDWAQNALCAANVPLIEIGDVQLQQPGVELFGGLVHEQIGQAGIQLEGDRLTVSNIGSSGKDGVSIDLGETDGFSFESDFFQPGGPAGALAFELERPPSGIFPTSWGVILESAGSNGTGVSLFEGGLPLTDDVQVILLNNGAVVQGRGRPAASRKHTARREQHRVVREGRRAHRSGYRRLRRPDGPRLSLRESQPDRDHDLRARHGRRGRNRGAVQQPVVQRSRHAG